MGAALSLLNPRNNAVANGNNSNPNENQRVPFLQKLVSIIVQMLIMHLVMYFLTGGKNKISQKNGELGWNNLILDNSFKPGDVFDLYIFLNNNHSVHFDHLKNNGTLIQIRESEIYDYKKFNKYEKVNYSFFLNDSWVGEKYLSVAVIPISFYENRTYYLLDSTIKTEFKDKILVENIPITIKMIPFESEKDETYNLIDNKHKKLEEKVKKEEIYHIKKRIDINIIFDKGKHRINDFNMPHMKTWKINIEEKTYTPPIYLSDFWLLEADYYLLDDQLLVDIDGKTNYICEYHPYAIKNGQVDYIIEKNTYENKKLNITINYSTCSLMYYIFTTQMNNSIVDLANNKSFSIHGLTSITATKEINMMKKILMTTNIYMLIFSAIFILLHTIFSFFSFKNDMQFWYKNDSMKGLSALSVITTFVCDIILTLYLYDSENTSGLLLFEMFIGLLLSAWKVTKVINISFTKKYPFIHIKDKKNYTESMTKKYDKIAIKYVGIVLLPCAIGYAIYSLFYHKYKSWYSYIISVLAGTVYTFGFIMMTPQLYINYKLKSVEHLPWRALIYKSLNTFIDDIAFFLIDMPWMHKLSCFRDDIIFILYIYQRCIYKMDKNRDKKLSQNAEQTQISDQNTPAIDINQIQDGNINTKKND